MTGTNSTSICERTRCERNENASISSGVTDTSDNFRSCNPGVFNGGATYRQYPTNQSLPPSIQRAVVGSRRVSATMHKCATCGRAFTRRPNLQRHASGCRPTPSYMLSLPDSPGDSRNLLRSPDLPVGRMNLPDFVSDLNQAKFHINARDSI